MNRLQVAEQLRKAIQKYADTLPDEEALEIATIYPLWKAGTKYKKDSVVSYGVNSVNDPQQYRVLKTHKAEITPDVDTDNYLAFGVGSTGYPVWIEPTGNEDSYDKGDIVEYNGTLYISEKNNDTVESGADEKMWSIYTA